MIATVQGLSKFSRFVLRINDCEAFRVSIFDVKKCSGGGQLRWSRRQWFFKAVRWIWWVKQWKRKCSMVSGLWRQLQRSSCSTAMRCKNVRSRQCPDKSWISWCFGLISCKIIEWSMEGKKLLVICEALFTLAHSTFHCFLKCRCSRFLTLDQAIPTFLWKCCDSSSRLEPPDLLAHFQGFLHGLEPCGTRLWTCCWVEGPVFGFWRWSASLGRLNYRFTWPNQVYFAEYKNNSKTLSWSIPFLKGPVKLCWIQRKIFSEKKSRIVLNRMKIELYPSDPSAGTRTILLIRSLLRLNHVEFKAFH